MRYEIGGFWLSKRPGSERWYRTWFDPKARQTRRASLRTEDFEQAKLRLAEWVVSKAQLKDSPTADTPIATVLARYKDNHSRHTVSAEANRYALLKWSNFWQDGMVSDLTIANQERFIQWMQDQGLSAGYIRRVFDIGKAALNWCWRRQEIQQPPYILTPERGQPRERILTPAESAALIQASMEFDHVHRFTILMFCTLSRPCAILDLTRFQIDRKARLINLLPPGTKQTKKRRPVVPITDTLAGYLDQWDGDYLVNWRGKQIKRIVKSFRQVRINAGLGSDVTAYTIRHTMATEMRRAGVPWPEIMGWLGHQSGTTTDVYAKHSPDYLSVGAKAIDAYMTATQLLRKALSAAVKSKG